VLTVYKFGPIGRCPDISPFVIKLETWLRMARIPYRCEPAAHAKQPLKKLPVVLDEGVLIPDSSVVIEHLAHKHGDPLDEARLDRRQRALREATKALIESELYWVGYCIRWCIDENFEQYKPALRQYARQTVSPLERLLLPMVEPLAFKLVQRQCKRQAWEQGMGRHDRERLMKIGIDGWTAVAELLGSGPHAFGERPSALDATLYGFLDSYLGTQAFRSPVHEFIASRSNLVDYWSRLRERYWSDEAPAKVAAPTADALAA
jgi:glutathione S-transferase